MLQFTFGFLIAFISFHINHRIKRVVDIKILINTLFDVYGNIEAFSEYNRSDVNQQLMNEILNLEKMHDNNYYVKVQVKKLKELRKLFFADEYNEITINKELEKIKFKRLGRTFIILSTLNLNPELLITDNKN